MPLAMRAGAPCQPLWGRIRPGQEQLQGEAQLRCVCVCVSEGGVLLSSESIQDNSDPLKVGQAALPCIRGGEALAGLGMEGASRADITYVIYHSSRVKSGGCICDHSVEAHAAGWKWGGRGTFPCCVFLLQAQLTMAGTVSICQFQACCRVPIMCTSLLYSMVPLQKNPFHGGCKW